MFERILYQNIDLHGMIYLTALGKEGMYETCEKETLVLKNL